MTNDDNVTWGAFGAQRLTDIIPPLGDSQLLTMLYTDTPDVATAAELGLALLQGRPLVLVRTPYQKVPSRLLRIAEGVVNVDLTEPADAILAKIAAAIVRIEKRLARKDATSLARHAG